MAMIMAATAGIKYMSAADCTTGGAGVGVAEVGSATKLVSANDE